MAGSNTCAAADSSLPNESLEAIKKLINDHQHDKWEQRSHDDLDDPPNTFKRPREYLDDHDCCVIEDLGGAYCGKEKCAFGPKVRYSDKQPNHKPHKPLK
jgi:hypothetical protein